MDGEFISVYIYQWTYNEDYIIEIRGYGLLNGQRVCVCIDDFLPHIYVSDVTDIDISNCIKYSITEKENLYNFNHRKQIFYKIYFRNKASIYAFIRDNNLDGKAHEQNASPLLQFTTQRKLPQVGWVKFKPAIIEQDKCLLYNINYKDIYPGEGPFVKPLACAFDLEVYSTIPGAMPSNKPGDEIFQISVVFSDGEDYLLSLKGNDYTDQDDVIQLDTETELLTTFCQLLATKKPTLLYGYNILGFDINYLIQRCKRLFLLDNLTDLGYGNKPAEIKTIRWSSGAFGEQEFTMVDWEGIVVLDLYPIIKRDYKFSNYKLETVAQELLGYGKDPITVKDITRAYETKAMQRVGYYCVKDSKLCLELAEKMSTWIGLVQMANVCHVQPMTLYIHGQQIKIHSQVYNYCHWNNIVVNTNAYKTPSNMRYTGAYVMDPIPGLYQNVVPFDFSSLYPSIIITENICYSTIANKDCPDEKCNTFTWEDHSGCKHDPKVIAAEQYTKQINDIDAEILILRNLRDKSKLDKRKDIQQEINVKRALQKPLRKARADFKAQKKTVICAKHSFRFLKQSEKQGVIPTIIQNLLLARKEIRNKLKTETDALHCVILDKQQLAYKVSANSMYGAMGVRSGYLPYMPGAMTVTYCGREAIKKSLKIIESDFEGKVIYGDTDSNYVQFPSIPIDTLWDYSIDVAKKVSAHFPKTMSLEFEEKIYKQFILLGKKKYVYTAWSDGKTKIGHKGIILSRRDNPKVVRAVYSNCLDIIFTGKNKQDIIYMLIDRLSRLKCMYTIEDFVLTKSVGSSEGDYDEETGYIGSYKVTKPKDADENDNWQESRLPAHVQLAKRMCKRGIPVQPGTRLEIVVVDKPNAVKLGDKFEDLDYFMEKSWYLKLDIDYYLKSMINPIDQMLLAVFNIEPTQRIIQTLKHKQECLTKIKNMRKPKLVFKN
uniref:DNA-directed DNA polymerase n=1 Tax=Rhinella marina erythrocytic-like virus TaxID=2859906 RepID=A0A8F6UA98_9VIRU|nr:DNA polymerase family B exonuclease [Rhinella marina erythrocytic-like virus]